MAKRILRNRRQRKAVPKLTPPLPRHPPDWPAILDAFTQAEAVLRTATEALEASRPDYRTTTLRKALSALTHAFDALDRAVLAVTRSDKGGAHCMSDAFDDQTEYRPVYVNSHSVESGPSHPSSKSLSVDWDALQNSRKARGLAEYSHVATLTPVRSWRWRAVRESMNWWSFFIGFMWGGIATMVFGSFVFG